jgi:hypothetical protein
VSEQTSKHTVDRLNPRTSVTPPFNQQTQSGRANGLLAAWRAERGADGLDLRGEPSNPHLLRPDQFLMLLDQRPGLPDLFFLFLNQSFVASISRAVRRV